MEKLRGFPGGSGVDRRRRISRSERSGFLQWWCGVPQPLCVWILWGVQVRPGGGTRIVMEGVSSWMETSLLVHLSPKSRLSGVVLAPMRRPSPAGADDVVDVQVHVFRVCFTILVWKKSEHRSSVSLPRIRNSNGSSRPASRDTPLYAESPLTPCPVWGTPPPCFCIRHLTVFVLGSPGAPPLPRERSSTGRVSQ